MKYELITDSNFQGTNHGHIYLMSWQVNQKMLLILTASLMYWSLQKAVEEADSYPSPADGSSCSTITDASPAPSISGEDEISSLCGEVSNLSMDDAASDTTVSSLVENDMTCVGEWNYELL